MQEGFRCSQGGFWRGLGIAALLICWQPLGIQAQVANDIHALSPRLGSEIDQKERSYFGLFARVDSFEAAISERRADGSFVVRIRRVAQADTLVVVQADQAAVLAEVLEYYEDVGHIQKLDWKKLRGLAQYRVRQIPTREVQVALRDGGEERGQLLYVDDDLMLLWQAAGPYRWRETEKVAVVPLAAVQYLSGDVFRRSATIVGPTAGGNILLGVGLHAFAGSSLQSSGPGLANLLVSLISIYAGKDRSHYYTQGNRALIDHVVGQIKGWMAFWRGLSPELEGLVEWERSNPPPVTVSLGDARASIPRARFHVSFGSTTALTTPRSVDAYYTTGFDLLRMDAVVMAPQALFIDGAASLTDRFNAGMNVTTSLEFGNKVWQERLYGVSISPFIEYIVRPHDPAFYDPKGRYQVSVGGGASWNWSYIKVETQFNPIQYRITPDLEEEADPRHTGRQINAYLRVALDYFITHKLSVQGRLNGRVGPGLHIEAFDRSYRGSQGYRSGVYGWEEHTARLLPLEIFFGVRWHL